MLRNTHPCAVTEWCCRSVGVWFGSGLVWSVFSGRLSCSSEAAAALLPHSLNRRRLATSHRQFGGNVPTSGTLGETRLRHFSHHITVLPGGKRFVGSFLRSSRRFSCIKTNKVNARIWDIHRLSFAAFAKF